MTAEWRSPWHGQASTRDAHSPARRRRRPHDTPACHSGFSGGSSTSRPHAVPKRTSIRLHAGGHLRIDLPRFHRKRRRTDGGAALVRYLLGRGGKDPGSLAGWHWLTSGAKLELETTHIPARLGIRFGIAFVFRGDKDATIDCQVLWRFPPTTNPDSHTTMTERTVQHSETVDVAAVSGHLFVYEWGLVPGTYVVELWLRGTKLISKSYEVFLP